MTRIRPTAVLLAAAALGLRCHAQSLGGAVVAADTGLAVPGAVVIAFQRTATMTQRPAVYKAFTDAHGGFTMAVASGQYQLCVTDAGMYVDPCRWGGAVVAPSGATNVSLRLAKGGWFVVRVHDIQQLLGPLETSTGGTMSAVVTRPSGSQFLLPKLGDDGRFRDYGAIVPLNVQMTVKMMSSDARVGISDVSGAPLAAQGTPFLVTPPPAIAAAGTAHGPLFRQPDATVIHVYTGQP